MAQSCHALSIFEKDTPEVGKAQLLTTCRHGALFSCKVGLWLIFFFLCTNGKTANIALGLIIRFLAEFPTAQCQSARSLALLVRVLFSITREPCRSKLHRPHCDTSQHRSVFTASGDPVTRVHCMGIWGGLGCRIYTAGIAVTPPLSYFHPTPTAYSYKGVLWQRCKCLGE